MMAAPIMLTGATLQPGRFLINTVVDTADALIALLMNWNPDAKR